MNARYNRYKHHRHSIRLNGYDYSRPGLYFITICVRNRECILSEINMQAVILTNFGKILEKFWLQLPQHFNNVQLDTYVIMPNHLHGIINIIFDKKGVNPVAAIPAGAIHELPLLEIMNNESQSMESAQTPNWRDRRKMLLARMIGYFKINSAKEINLIQDISGLSFWQRNYYEHIIRDESELIQIRRYIKDNPRHWLDDENNPINIK